MIKKIFVVCFAFIICMRAFAQGPTPTYSDASQTKGFKKENIFIGGSLSVGFANNTFSVGGIPEVGYTVAQWLDAGIAINVNYSSQRADPYYNGNVRQRSFNYGAGAFVRLFPVNFLFVQLQPEENWIKYNFRDYNSGQTLTATTRSSSILGGIGYAQRIVGQSSFYTVLMIDLLRDPDSPYRDYNNYAYPVVRAGFNFYLHPSRRK